MIIPNKLKIGDKIGVIAPSATISSLTEDKIQQGYSFLKNKGLIPVEHSQCRLNKEGLAGTIEDRVNAIHEFAKNPEIKCIMAFWGGLNTNQLIEYLDYDLIAKNPKIFIGYSDTCALLSAISKKTNLVTYMGPSVITFCKAGPIDYSWDYFKKICIDDSSTVEIKDSPDYTNDLYQINNTEKRQIKINDGMISYGNGIARGPAFASNLATLIVLLSTDFCPDLDGRILFIEEAEDFDALMIRRFFTHARQAGIFKKISGLVIGKFMEESKLDKESLKDILNDALEGINIPVIQSANFGHTDPIFTIPNGQECTIDATRKKIVFNL